MGRKRIEIDQNVFKETIQQLEAQNNYSNLNQLYIAVAKIIGCPKGVVPLRISEWGISIKTTVGKRGRNGSQHLHNNEKRIKNKKTSHPGHITQLRRETPKKYQKLIDKIEKGSKAAALKLNCLYCANYERLEVRYCPCLSCPAWSVRPYQIHGANNAEDGNS